MNPTARGLKLKLIVCLTRGMENKKCANCRGGWETQASVWFRKGKTEVTVGARSYELICVFEDNEWNGTHTGPDKWKQVFIVSFSWRRCACADRACALMRVWRHTQEDNMEQERTQTYSSLPWLHRLSHCRRRAFFMLHCFTHFSSLGCVFTDSSPRMVRVLRRPKTIINIAGCC